MPARMGLPHLGAVVDYRLSWLCLLVLTLCGCQTSGIEQAYPNRSLSFIVPWEPGTSGDAASRILVAALEDELRTTVDVTNQPSENGVIAHVNLAQSPSDGYTLGVLTVEVTMTHWTGITGIDFNRFSPIALVAVSPAAITVRNDATWQNIDDFVAALKANPRALRASGTYLGGIWDLHRIGFLEAVGLDPSTLPWKPSSGAKSALQELLAGDVDVVIAPLSEVDSLRKTDQVRTLAVTAHQRLPSAPDIPTLKELEIDFTSPGNWLTLAAPKDLPNARLELLRVAIWNISRRSSFKESLERAGFQLRYITGSSLESFLREEDARNGMLLNKAGLALE